MLYYFMPLLQSSDTLTGMDEGQQVGFAVALLMFAIFLLLVSLRR